MMKTRIYLLVAFCLVSTMAFAQKITEKELQGQWDISTFDVGGVILNIPKEEITFSEEIESGMDEETKEGIKMGMGEAFEGFKGAYVKFEGKKVTMYLETADTGTYTIKEEDGKTFITILYDEDGTEDQYEIQVKGKELHILAESDEKTLEFVYVKK